MAYQTNSISPLQLQALAKTLLYDREEYAKAIGVLRTAVLQFPKSSAVLVDLGIAFNRLGNLAQAEKYFRKALVLKRNAHILSLLAYVEDRRGKWQKAMRTYRQAIKTDPTYEEAQYNLGLLLKFRKRYRQAAKHFRRSIQLDPRYAEAHSELGFCLLKDKQFKAAEKHLRKAIALDKGNIWTHAYLANLLWQYGKLEEAKRQYLYLLRLDPKDAYFHGLYADFLKATGRS